MIYLMNRLKARHGLKIAVVNNESRKLNAYRINTFRLNSFVDAFISSCFVHIRKPDTDIFRRALDATQADAKQVVYIENSSMFVLVVEEFGIRSILHTDFASTRALLASFGLLDDDNAPECMPGERAIRRTAPCTR
jgi:putative hydrolase of the HAD superfamily